MSTDVTSLVDKATSALLLDIDWDTTLQIVDLIRQGDITPKSSVNTLLFKIHDSNPNVVILALQVLESVVKNCGQAVHEHVATRDFMEEIRVLLKTSTNEEVQKKIMLLLATWVYAFRTEPKYRAVKDTVNILKAEGFKIPSTKIESDAMFTADSAPDWADGECCHRCRSQFTLLRRKHHCRACGQVFCADCSNKSSTIPKFGIERDVRVCDYCFEDINNGTRAIPLMKSDSSSSTEKIPSDKPSSNSGKKSSEELQEEEELQLALALSKSEAENKEKEKLRATYNILGTGWRQNQPSMNSTPPKSVSSLIDDKEETDPELAKYLNRSYWEQQRQKHKSKETESEVTIRALSPTHPSAPTSVAKGNSLMKSNEDSDVNPLPTSGSNHHILFEAFQNGGVEEVDDFVSTLRSQLEIFVNRMKSNQSRGRPIANDTAVQSLFMNITAMHAQLLTFIQEQDRKRVHCEQLQDKISQIRDARAALDALREEHRDKVRRDREEQERIRQMQMMQKLEIMRKKKQEYLEYQRQLALHRMAESERQILSAQHGPAIPGGHPPQPGFPPMNFPQGYPPQAQMGGYMYPGHAGDNPPNQAMMPPFQGPQPPVGPSGQPPLSGYSGTHPPPPPPNSEFAHYNMPATSPNMNMPAYGPPITSPPGAAPSQAPDSQMIPQHPPPPPAANQQPPQPQTQQPPPPVTQPQPAEEQEAPLISFD